LGANLLGAQRHRRFQAILGEADDAPLNGRRDKKADDGRRQEAQGKEERIFNHVLAVSVWTGSDDPCGGGCFLLLQ
jgi:hypothetical protein